MLAIERFLHSDFTEEDVEVIVKSVNSYCARSFDLSHNNTTVAIKKFYLHT